MGHLIKKPELKITTKDGECELHITLDLNINLNTGEVVQNKVKNIINEDVVKENNWEVPDFKNSEKIKFGKKGLK